MPWFVKLEESVLCCICERLMRKGIVASTDGIRFWHRFDCVPSSAKVAPL
ncbi:MAG TPA: hypothetical protein VGG32_03790 [Thermoplasmata archaeon]|jgi:hypothetical protein